MGLRALEIRARIGHPGFSGLKRGERVPSMAMQATGVFASGEGGEACAAGQLQAMMFMPAAWLRYLLACSLTSSESLLSGCW